MNADVAARIGPGDRLSLTVFLSLAVHALIVLGIGFSWHLSQANRTPPMIEITLADHPQETAPKDYDYLAQANQDGGGTAEEKQIPDKPQQAITPGVTEGRQAVQSAPAPTPPQPKRQSTPEVSGAAPAKSQRSTPKPEPTPEPSAAELINATRSVAARSEFSVPSESIDARYPTKRRISASTKAHAAAAYMREWIRKVEQIGNLNYPREAARAGLTGRLILEVTLRPDGSIYGVKLLRRSEHAILDEAARRIVRLAGPFSPVPEAVLQGDDLLVVTRTWDFQRGSRLRAN